MSSACAFERGIAMINPEKIKYGYRRKLKKTLLNYLAKLDLGELSPQEVISSLLLSLSGTNTPKKINDIGFLDFEKEKGIALQAVLGEERVVSYKRYLLEELLSKSSDFGAKLSHTSSRKKKDEIRAKFYKQEQELMDFCILLGVDWSEIQEILDATINC